MNPVTISVIPGIKAQQYGYTIAEDKPAEDYSLILMSSKRNGKEYTGGMFVSNSALPLKTEELEKIRATVNQKLEKV